MSKRKRLPAVEGSPLDRVISKGERIESIPALPFALLLLALSSLSARFESSDSLVLWGIFLIDWALLAALPRLGISYGPPKPSVVLLAVLRAPFMLLPHPWAWVLQALGTVLVIYGFWIEPSRLVVSRQRLRSPKLDLAAPLRVLQLGDLHLERLSVRERKLVEAARRLQPDLILFTGDVLSYSNVDDPSARAVARDVLAGLVAPLGVYAVAGSPPVDRVDVLEEVYRGLAVTLLDGEVVRLRFRGNDIELFGLPCTHNPELDSPALEKFAPDGDAFKILLHHSPDLAPAASALGFDLQLSGHTHGGQVRLPFVGAIITSSVHGKRFESGRYRLGDMTLYVSRGIGMEGKAAPRVRLLCPPEIVLWEISGPV
jgi:predicted MPP superfamily phosphohydrolase